MGRKSTVLLLVCLVAGTPLLASEIETGVRSIASSGQPGWVSWTVPQIEPDTTICCATWIKGRRVGNTSCRLDGEHLSIGVDSRRATVGETPRGLRIFARVDSGGVNRIEAFSTDCLVETGDLSVKALGPVATDASVRWLAGRISADIGDDIDATLMALSLHPGEAASAALVSAARNEPGEVRGQALFWLAERAGDHVAGRLLDAATHDPDAEVREVAVFAIAQLSRERAVTTLIDLARTNRHADVRREAIFWLGQTNDPRSIDFLEEVVSATH